MAFVLIFSWWYKAPSCVVPSLLCHIHHLNKVLSSGKVQKDHHTTCFYFLSLSPSLSLSPEWSSKFLPKQKIIPLHFWWSFCAETSSSKYTVFCYCVLPLACPQMENPKTPWGHDNVISKHSLISPCMLQDTQSIQQCNCLRIPRGAKQFDSCPISFLWK